MESTYLLSTSTNFDDVKLAEISLQSFENNPLVYLTYPKGVSREVVNFHYKSHIQFTKEEEVELIKVIANHLPGKPTVAFGIVVYGPKPPKKELRLPVDADFRFLNKLKEQTKLHTEKFYRKNEDIEVKCDEGRPTCGQCRRLGNTCDYNLRAFFKDGTPRILKRTRQVTIIGSPVWDPSAQDREPRVQASVNRLPPFSTLTTDDEREQKAESRDPGTFVVVANLTSFAGLPEYWDKSLGNIRQEFTFLESEGDNNG
ncbi:hypothetical protein BKA65DRAFT_559601 [Rhexocercosporidium sp. MPI-PUGE-AT-0058]|nr:hypothetical protein BKA65DRAFT_559601 [Rhexocercosporidium sp. MPI-PUGE-AT-0058]